MKNRDVLELAIINFKQHLRKNYGIIIILTIIIIVFNLTYSLVAVLKGDSTKNITENSNLKIIEVSSVEEEISDGDFNSIETLNNVVNMFYNFSAGCSIESDDITEEINVIGLDKEKCNKFVGSSLDLKDYQIILNNTYKNVYKIGQKIEISYNCRVTESKGKRVNKKYEIIGFYEQPVINSWCDSVGIISENCVLEIYSSNYGLNKEDIQNSNVYKQSALVFVNEVDNVKSVANYIDSKGLMVSYALMSSEQLPLFAKIVIAIGTILIGLLLFMSVIVMNATINSTIQGRYKEIGIMKSVGIKSQYIRKVLYGELIILWWIISIIAIVASVICVKLINTCINMDNIDINVTQILISLVGTLMIILGTTMATIKKVAKLEVVEVLRCE